jgi:hypothetical protein
MISEIRPKAYSEELKARAGGIENIANMKLPKESDMYIENQFQN